MNTLILTLLLMTTSHPYELSPICTQSATYTEGPYRGPKGGCYCINPTNGRKKYISRDACQFVNIADRITPISNLHFTTKPQ